MGYRLDIKLSAFEDMPRNFYCAKCDKPEPAIVITTDNVVIGICEDCLKDFIENDCKPILDDVYSSCWYCKHFVVPIDGRHYAGTCPFKQYDCWHYEHCDKFERKE